MESLSYAQVASLTVVWSQIMSGAGLRFYNEVDLTATPFDPFSLFLIYLI